MNVEQKGISLSARDRVPLVISRDTNTIVLRLKEDEILSFVAQLAGAGSHFGEAFIVLEIDAITHPREVFE